MIGLSLGLGLGAGMQRRLAPLDALAASLRAAHGLRRLRTGWTGPLVTVRRSSDNAVADISAAADGWLDTAALLTFCGAASGYVTKWWDQSGNGLHVLQSTAAAQPRIVNAGVVDIAPNGRPWLVFSGAQSLATSTLFMASDLPTGTNPGSILAVGKATSTGTWGWMLSYGVYAAGMARAVGKTSGDYSVASIINADAVATNAAALMSSLVATFAAASPYTRVWANGAAATNTAAPGTPSTSYRLYAGCRPGGGYEYWYGGISELAVLAVALSAAEAATIRTEHIQSWGTA